MPSPPKPWERGQAAASVASTVPAPAPSAAPASTSASTSSTNPPAVPVRPAAISANQPSISQSNPYQTPYSTPYSSYSSPYSRFGSTAYSPYGSTGMYGGMGYGGGYGMGGMSSMYGGGMPGYGGIGGMPYGGLNPYDPNAPGPSLTQTLSSTTQHTFALLHSIVQTFTGLSQMLESTFMATHSSFFAMVGVVEQFTVLRNALGGVMGLFGLVQWMKGLLTGRRGQPEMRHEFRDFVNGRPVQGPAGPPSPKPSRKPLIIFFLAIFGIPYAMHKLIQIISRAQQQQSLPPNSLPPLTPAALSFARALYPFTPSAPSELALSTNEIVAIMAKLDPTTGVEVDPRLEVEGCEWWKGRTREGREGWFPKKWVEVLEKKEGQDGKGSLPLVEAKADVVKTID